MLVSTYKKGEINVPDLIVIGERLMKKFVVDKSGGYVGIANHVAKENENIAVAQSNRECTKNTISV